MYSDDNIYFFPDFPSYITGGCDLIKRRSPGAGINLAFTSWGTNALLYEAQVTQGALIVAGELWPNDNSPAAIAGDYIAFGEECIAIGGYLSEDPWDKAAYVAEDMVKWALIVFILILAVAYGAGYEILA
jgi:hypothetical protein